MTKKTAAVVIGAGFGDEGKGVLTDWFAAAAGANAVVARFNSSAQAGHTVVEPSGRRHVFSHFGSGSFAGATTFLSRFFVVHPILFLKERQALATKGVAPAVIVDPASLVTTPYDMLINQLVEDARGEGRHGSCGIGFGETIERSLRPAFTLTVGDLEQPARLAATLDRIRSDWVPARLAALGLGSPVTEIDPEQVRARFVADCQEFRAGITVAGIERLAAAPRIIFEGAQGLLLDQDMGWFPHVTRSNTGLRNAAMLAAEAGLDGLEVTYVTRAYTTRHGCGPLPHALPGLPYPGVTDETNLPNRYQGSLRFAWLDLDRLGASLDQDLRHANIPAGLRIRRQLAVTCLDQVDRRVRFIERGRLTHQSPEAFLDTAHRAAGAESCLAGAGPTRDDVMQRVSWARAGNG